MDGMMRTTGKVYEPRTYKCSACGKIYHESEGCICPSCGSDERTEHLQTVASLSEENSLVKLCELLDRRSSKES